MHLVMYMYTASNLCIIQYVLLERTLDFSLHMFFTSKNYFSEIIVVIIFRYRLFTI